MKWHPASYRVNGRRSGGAAFPALGARPAAKGNAMQDFDAIAARCAELARTRAEQTTEEAHAELMREKAAEKGGPVESITRRAEDEAREIGFSARLLVQATLPHSRPKPGVNEFKRSNGFVTVKIAADSDYGLPYGTYPRLLLAWVTTEAVRTKSRELTLGDSLREFMARLDLAATGGTKGTIRPLRDQMRRLFKATVSATYQDRFRERDRRFCPVEGSDLFWDLKSPGQVSLWKSTIKLNQTFYEEITTRPVPVDMHVLRGLAKSRSPLALDIYQWLTYRMSYLRDPTTISWEAMELQLGGDYGRTRDFKAKFLIHLKQVIELYPQARVEPGSSGLKLLPSRPHVPMRLLRGRR